MLVPVVINTYIDDEEVIEAIRSAAHEVCDHCSGQWRVRITPSPEEDQWRLKVYGPNNFSWCRILGAAMVSIVQSSSE